MSLKDQGHLEKIPCSDLDHAKYQDQLSDLNLDLKDQWSFPISVRSISSGKCYSLRILLPPRGYCFPHIKCIKMNYFFPQAVRIPLPGRGIFMHFQTDSNYSKRYGCHDDQDPEERRRVNFLRAMAWAAVGNFKEFLPEVHEKSSDWRFKNYPSTSSSLARPIRMLLRPHVLATYVSPVKDMKNQRRHWF